MWLWFIALCLLIPPSVRPVESGVLIDRVAVGIIREQPSLSVTRSGQPALTSCPAQFILTRTTLEPIRIEAITRPGKCSDLPNLKPNPGTWEAYLSGGSLATFFQANPGIVCVQWVKSGLPLWHNQRTACEVGLPWAKAPIVVLRPESTYWLPVYEAWGSCNPWKINVLKGGALSWHIVCGDEYTTDSTTYFLSCDADWDELRTIADWRIFSAQPWDWDGDEIIGPFDFIGFQGCLIN